MANPGNVARGLKAAISNPNNSEEAKQNAASRLEDMRSSGELDSAEAHASQVERGHKAAISNPNVSQEAKDNSARVVEDISD